MPINQADGHQLSWQDVSRKLDEDLTGYSATIEHEGSHSFVPLYSSH